jgi:predicted MFS family arabinose efflux permease
MLTGFGPFVASYLANEQWSQEQIGFVLTAGGVVGLLSQIPGGELLDSVPAKRLVVAAGIAMVAIGAPTIALQPIFAFVFAAAAVQGAGAR